MLQARDELGFSVSVSENLAAADFVSAFREYAAEGYDLIVAPGNQFQDAVEQIYEEFPNSHFAGINFSFNAKNVTSMGFNNVQAGFLAGALAGLFTKSGSCGYIGGTEIQPTTDSSQGMKLGIEYVNKGAKFVSSMTGSWDDVAKGKELGISQITTANVDVIFSFAGACNTGIIQAAKEKGVWVIVEPMDILDTDPGAICGSVLMSNGALIMFAANVVVKGESGQAMIGDISNGVIGLGKLNDAVEPGIRSALDTITKDLAAGKINL
jgi:basic membrane protein A